MPYNVIVVKQLIADNSAKFEVVYDPGTDKEFSEPVVFFALCDVLGQPCTGEKPPELEDYIGVILPVTFDAEEGLIPTLLADYKLPDEQEVRLRKKEGDMKRNMRKRPLLPIERHLLNRTIPPTEVLSGAFAYELGRVITEGLWSDYPASFNSGMNIFAKRIREWLTNPPEGVYTKP